MKRMVRARETAVLLLAGFLVWAGAFILIYAGQATGCRLGWDGIALVGTVSLLRTVLAALVIIACGLHLGVIVRVAGFARRRRLFLRDTGRLLALSALGASMFCFAGILWLSPCG